MTALPGDFVGPALAPEDYLHALPAPVRRELARLVVAIAAGEEVEPDVRATMADVTARTTAALSTGPGVIVVRGVPVAGQAPAAVARLYRMIGGALGRPLPQNLEGETLTDIRDTGADPADPDVRLYRTLYLEVAFQPGDLQWLRNGFVLHKRTAYEAPPEPDRKRHLLRLWLALDRLAGGTPRFPLAGGAPR